MLRLKELEIQYHAARLEQQRKQQEAESSKSHQLTRQVSTFSQTETELRTQLNIYVEKFKQVCRPVNPSLVCIIMVNTDQMQVEETLNNSNDLFLSFRKETEDQRKKIARLETLCRGMQAQGRGQVPMHELDHEEHDEEDEEVTESEYEYEDEDSAEYDDDTEEDGVEPAPERRPFGPVPPPPPQPQAAQGKVNGHTQANGQMNGVKR